MKSLAERFAWARTQAGLKKSQIAKEMGVGASSITQIEDGTTRTLKASTLVGLQRATGISGEWVVTGVGSPYPDDQIDRIYKDMQKLPREYRDKIEQDIAFLLRLADSSES